MNKPVSLVVFVAGMVLILYGIGASHSFDFEMLWRFAGSHTERTLAQMGTGAVFMILGAYGLYREPSGSGFNKLRFPNRGPKE